MSDTEARKPHQIPQMRAPLDNAIKPYAQVSTHKLICHDHGQFRLFVIPCPASVSTREKAYELLAKANELLEPYQQILPLFCVSAFELAEVFVNTAPDRCDAPYKPSQLNVLSLHGMVKHLVWYNSMSALDRHAQACLDLASVRAGITVHRLKSKASPTEVVTLESAMERVRVTAAPLESFTEKLNDFFRLFEIDAGAEKALEELTKEINDRRSRESAKALDRRSTKTKATKEVTT